MKFSTRYLVAIDVFVEADDIGLARIECDRRLQDLGKIISKNEFDLKELDRDKTYEIETKKDS